MAIVNTFKKCLESPYLFVDADAKKKVPGLLSMAGDRLEAAANLLAAPKADAADICLMSYEAMFACVRALVYDKGYREAGLKCLLLACGGLYVVPGDLEAEHLHKFEKLQGLKLSPGESVEAASAMVKKTIRLLTPKPAAAPVAASS